MKKILSYDWTPKTAKSAQLAHLGFPFNLVPRKRSSLPILLLSQTIILTKYVGSRWLIISLVFGLLFFFTLTKFHKEELGQYPAMLTSHLVNNTSIYVTYLFYLSFGDHLLHYLFPTLVLIFILNF